MGGYERIAHETLDLAVLGELGLELLDPRGQLRALLTKGILARPEAREQPIDGLGPAARGAQHCSKLVQRRRRAAHVFTRIPAGGPDPTAKRSLSSERYHLHPTRGDDHVSGSRWEVLDRLVAASVAETFPGLPSLTYRRFAVKRSLSPWNRNPSYSSRPTADPARTWSQQSPASAVMTSSALEGVTTSAGWAVGGLGSADDNGAVSTVSTGEVEGAGTVAPASSELAFAFEAPSAELSCQMPMAMSVPASRIANERTGSRRER